MDWLFMNDIPKEKANKPKRSKSMRNETAQNNRYMNAQSFGNGSYKQKLTSTLDSHKPRIHLDYAERTRTHNRSTGT